MLHWSHGRFAVFHSFQGEISPSVEDLLYPSPACAASAECFFHSLHSWFYLHWAIGPFFKVGEGATQEGKRKGNAGNRQTRACSSMHSSLNCLRLAETPQGRFFVLSTIIIDFEDCNTWDRLKGGLASFHTFKFACLQDGNIALCSRTRWKVRTKFASIS